MKKIIIAAVSRNFVIGREGQTPWYSKEDLSHFRKTTLGHTLIMGRKTFESIGRTLDSRSLIVVSTKAKSQLPSSNLIDYAVQDLDEAFLIAEYNGLESVFIIGGGEIFEQTIPIADEMILSHFDFEIEGDTFFPNYNPADWQKRTLATFDDFKIVHYTR